MEANRTPNSCLKNWTDELAKDWTLAWKLTSLLLGA
jgi:hypothetical protein